MSIFFKSKQPEIHIEQTEYPECIFYFINGKFKNSSGKVSIKYTIATNNFYILDITCTKENSGLGSILMNEMLKLAHENHVTSIDGYLSETDKNHIDKLNYFYTKFGFSIIPSTEENHIADIHLEIL